MKSTLWSFGDSGSLPWQVEVAESWPYLIAQRFGAELRNESREAVDNHFIYSNYLQHKSEIKSGDIVIIQWTSPNRKMFCNVAVDPSYSISLGAHTWSRSPLRRDEHAYGRGMRPRDSGIAFFDEWYAKYYSLREQQINFKAYLDATASVTTPIYFDRESVDTIAHWPTVYLIDLIRDAGVNRSKYDLHPTAEGHRLIAEKIYPHVKRVP